MSDTVVSEYDDFVDRTFERPPFLVEPLVVSGGIHVIFGREGAGKTQLVLTMIRDLINGEDLFSKYDTRPSKVCYFGVDMPLQMLQSRLRRVRAEINRSEQLLVAARDSPLDITNVPQTDEWVQDIREFSPDAIFVDTLHKIHNLDENASQTVAIVFRHLKRVFGGAPAIVLVHHAGKENPNPEIHRQESDRQRGSSAWLADSDLGVYMTKQENPLGRDDFQLSFPRLRYCGAQSEIKLEMNSETLLLERKRG